MNPQNLKTRARWGLLLSAMLPALESGVVGAPPPPAQATETRGAMHDTVNEETLRKTIEATSSFDSQMKSLAKPATEGRPDVKSSLMSNSIILFDGTYSTIVPVGSILCLPRQYRNRVVSQIQGDFTFWPNFLKMNEKWLSAKEVPLEMAKGSAKAAAPVWRSIEGSSHVLVAVYKGGPISILEPVAEKGSENSNKSR